MSSKILSVLCDGKTEMGAGIVTTAVGGFIVAKSMLSSFLVKTGIKVLKVFPISGTTLIVIGIGATIHGYTRAESNEELLRLKEKQYEEKLNIFKCTCEQEIQNS